VRRKHYNDHVGLYLQSHDGVNVRQGPVPGDGGGKAGGEVPVAPRHMVKVVGWRMVRMASRRTGQKALLLLLLRLMLLLGLGVGLKTKKIHRGIDYTKCTMQCVCVHVYFRRRWSCTSEILFWSN
jgi:hypothetical protein